MKSARAAGIDYVRMAKGEIDFTFFSGIMPWDHAPGAMIIRELGGHIGYIRGDESYRPSQAPVRRRHPLRHAATTSGATSMRRCSD